MRRHVFLFISFLSLALFAEPYKPYPILMIHGYGGSSKDFGVIPNDNDPSHIGKGDTIIEGETFDSILPLMQPYAWAWYEWEKEQYPDQTPTYTPSDDPSLIEEAKVRARFPNKCFLEIINYPNRMSVDPETTYVPIISIPEIIRDEQGRLIIVWKPLEIIREGASALLRDRIKEVLNEYYGDWQEPSAKLIILAHSMGGLVTREALRRYPEIRDKIERVVMIGTPNQGSPWATWGECELCAFLMIYLCPFLWDWEDIPSKLEAGKIAWLVNLLNTMIDPWLFGIAGGVGYAVTEGFLLGLS